MFNHSFTNRIVLIVAAGAILSLNGRTSHAVEWEPPMAERSTDNLFRWKRIDHFVTPPGDRTAPGGVNGVNRRVQIQGYGGISGRFTEPQFQLANTVGRNSDNHNWYRHKVNKPTFYLGIEGGKPIEGGGTLEGGMQWEPESSTIDPTILPGWTLFFRGTVGHWHIWQQTIGARAAMSTLGVTTLTLKPDDQGKMTLFARSTGGWQNSTDFIDLSCPWPRLDGNINPAAIKVRRVVALTQAEGNRTLGNRGHETLLWADGSVISNLNFSGGLVAPVSRSANFTIGDFDTWPSTPSPSPTSPDVHMRMDAKGNVDNILPDIRLYPATPPWIIDFPDHPRLFTYPGEYVTGYPEEKVKIDLSNGKEVEGKKSGNGTGTPARPMTIHEGLQEYISRLR